MKLNSGPPAQAQETHGLMLSDEASFLDLSHIYSSVKWGEGDPVCCDPDGIQSLLHAVACGDHGGTDRCD